MAAEAPKLSVVVLSYNRPGMLQEALTAIFAQIDDRSEVILIDNASPGSDAVREVARTFPGLKCVFNPTNRGYTGGMNQGLSMAAGRQVLLTEDDIVPDPGCIPLLQEAMDQNPGLAIIAPVILNRADRSIRCAGGTPILEGVWQLKLRLKFEARDLELGKAVSTGYVPGACFLSPTDLLKRTGGFREDFNMYMEDVELGIRLNRMGLGLAVIPGATVTHFEPKTSAVPNPMVDFHRIKNLFACYLLHARAAVLPEFLIRYGAWALLKDIFQQPRMAWLRVRSLAWITVSLPRLLADRRHWNVASVPRSIQNGSIQSP